MHSADADVASTLHVPASLTLQALEHIPGSARELRPCQFPATVTVLKQRHACLSAAALSGRIGVRGTPSSLGTSHPNGVGSTVTGQPWADALRAWTNVHADSERPAPEAGCWAGGGSPRRIRKIEEARHAISSAASPDDSGSGAQPGARRGDGGCGSSSSSSSVSHTASAAASTASASAASTASAVAQIKADWEAFFSGTTPAAKKIALLQNGQKYAAIIQAQAASGLAQSASAKVAAVM